MAERLKDVLVGNMERSVYESKANDSFLPFKKINKIITDEAIKVELKLDKCNDKSLIQWIANEAPNLFAVTVQCLAESQDVSTAMKTFQEFRIKNGPEEPEKGFDDSERERVKFFGTHSVTETFYEKAFPSPPWGISSRSEFSSKRWSYSAPVFRPGEYKFELSRQFVLPVLAQFDKCSGQWGEVYRAKIHEEHWKHNNVNYMVL
jgi:hypothetical protein